MTLESSDVCHVEASFCAGWVRRGTTVSPVYKYVADNGIVIDAEISGHPLQNMRRKNSAAQTCLSHE